MNRCCIILHVGTLSLFAACNYPVEVAEHWGDLRRSSPAAPPAPEASVANSTNAEAGALPEAEAPGLPANLVPQVDAFQRGQGPKPPEPPGDAGAGAIPADCEVFQTQDGVNYGYDCHPNAGASSMYRCSCREDGFPNVSFSVAHACPTPIADLSIAARVASLRCNWDLEYDPELSAACESFEGTSDSGECVYSASCGGEAYRVECFENGEGAHCVCQVGGETVSTLQLDGLGCTLGQGYPSEGSALSNTQQAQRSLNLICGWALH